MCSMNAVEDLPHVLLVCPYLDGACIYALLLWSNRSDKTVYNLFLSALKVWPTPKLMKLILDPTSEISQSSLKAHSSNLLEKCITFTQDYIFSIDKQRKDFYGRKDKNIYMDTV